MRSAKRLGWVGLLAGMVACGAPEPLGTEDLRRATVTLVPGHCAGVIVEDGRHLLTAAHCVRPGEPRVEAELYDGTRLGGSSVLVDRGRDVAIFRLDAVAPVLPLPVALEPPAPGDGLLFAGRNDRPGEPQEAQLERRGRCPSLPEVPSALFTTLRGEKGDSGAPVVDRELRVVGLVHGGAACSIATPTEAFAPVVRQLAEADDIEVARQGLAPQR